MRTKSRNSGGAKHHMTRKLDTARGKREAEISYYLQTKKYRKQALSLDTF